MIFYFSGTGNSLYIAKKIQEKLGGDLISIKDIYKMGKFEYNPSSDEKVGIVYPVYFYTSAPIIKDFLSKIKLNNKDSVFLVANCGKTTGNANEILEKTLNKNNLKVDSKFSITMPDNYILLPTNTIKTKTEITKMLNESDKVIEDIINKIENNAVGDFNNHKGKLPGLLSPLTSFLYESSCKTKKFNIISDDCIGCSQCANICPSEAIVMKKCKPVWIKPKCFQCLACMHRCPQHCINYGDSTKNCGRYVNPRVEFNDFKM